MLSAVMWEIASRQRSWQGMVGGMVVSLCQGSDGSIDVPERSVVEVIVSVLVVPWLAVYVSQGTVRGLVKVLFDPCLGS